MSLEQRLTQLINEERDKETQARSHEEQLPEFRQHYLQQAIIQIEPIFQVVADSYLAKKDKDVRIISIVKENPDQIVSVLMWDLKIIGFSPSSGEPYGYYRCIEVEIDMWGNLNYNDGHYLKRRKRIGNINNQEWKDNLDNSLIETLSKPHLPERTRFGPYPYVPDTTIW